MREWASGRENRNELRNPLSAIQAGVGLMQKTLVEGCRSARALEIIERNARLQARLVNDLLDLSRLQRGKLQLQRAPVDVAKVVSASVASAAAATAAGLAFPCEAAPGRWVHGDFARLQQVVANILSNAMKFAPSGGSVHVAAARFHDGHACIAVQDTGMGIDREQLAGLFEMFQQGEVGAQRKAGLGLGLALVKGIVERHGGRQSGNAASASCSLRTTPTRAL